MKDVSLKMRKKPPTVFEEHVYKLVRQIPKGQVTTYQKVAEQLSPSRNLGRAVGNALKKNPYPSEEVPCHRVIRSDYLLGGYEGSKAPAIIQKKRRLLKEEGVRFDEKDQLINKNLIQ